MNFTKVINVMRLMLLSEFVILTVTFSGVFLFVSYAALLWTDKIIPPEMLTTTQVLVAGAIAAVVAKTQQHSPENRVKQSAIDYALMGVAVVQVILSINYVFLIWVQRSIPGEFAPAIGSLAITILTLTNFRGSSSNNSGSEG